MATSPPIPQIDPQTAALLAAQQQPWLGAPQAPPANQMPPPGAAPIAPPQPPSPDPSDALSPSTQGSTPTKPGPLKHLLTSFLYGAGQALKEKAGLPTDQQIAVQNAGIQNTQANTRAVNEQRAAVLAETQRQNQPFTVPDTAEYPTGIRGMNTTQGNFEKVIAPIFARNQGTANVASIKATSAEDVADIGAKAKTDVASKNADAKEVVGRLMAGLRQQGLGISEGRLALAQKNLEANLYGTVNGVPVPNAPMITGVDGTVHPGGLRGAANAEKQQGAVTGFKDLQGSYANTQAALDALHKSGSSFTDPAVVAAMADPSSITGKIINGKLVKANLTPQQITAITAVNQTREQAGILRSLVKGSNAEGQVQRVLDTLPSAGDTADFANSKMSQGRQVLGRLAPGVVGVAGGTRVAPTPTTPTIRLQAPDGTIKEFDAATAAHYIAKGAKVVK